MHEVISIGRANHDRAELCDETKHRTWMYPMIGETLKRRERFDDDRGNSKRTTIGGLTEIFDRG